MVENKLTASPRTEFGKGAARRTRREGRIPAVVYGHGTDPVHVTLPGHDAYLIVRASRNAVIDLDVDGKSTLVLVKDVQVNPVLRQIEHLDLIVIKRGEKVAVSVPVVTTGESAPGTIHTVELQELHINAPATSIPEAIEVSVEGLEDGHVVRIADLTLPKGVTTDQDEEAAVVLVAVPQSEESEGDAEAARSESAGGAADSE